MPMKDFMRLGVLCAVFLDPCDRFLSGASAPAMDGSVPQVWLCNLCVSKGSHLGRRMARHRKWGRHRFDPCGAAEH